MTLLMRDQENIEKGIQQGIKQGIEQEKMDTVRRMIEMGLFDLETIAQATGFTINEITTIKNNM